VFYFHFLHSLANVGPPLFGLLITELVAIPLLGFTFYTQWYQCNWVCLVNLKGQEVMGMVKEARNAQGEGEGASTQEEVCNYVYVTVQF